MRDLLSIIPILGTGEREPKRAPQGSAKHLFNHVLSVLNEFGTEQSWPEVEGICLLWQQAGAGFCWAQGRQNHCPEVRVKPWGCPPWGSFNASELVGLSRQICSRGTCAYNEMEEINLVQNTDFIVTKHPENEGNHEDH